MKVFNQSYKFRLYPTEAQKILLEKHFGAVRFIWNSLLTERKECYQTTGKSSTYIKDAKKITEMKKTEDFKWLKEINAQSLQYAAKTLDGAYNDFFKNFKGFPQFKSKKDYKFGFRIPQKVRVKNSKLYILKFKEGIKFKQHRNIEGKICFATVSRNSAHQYFVSITVEKQLESVEYSSKKAVGIDLGVKDLATLSNGEIFPNPKFTRNSEKKITKLARRLSKKAKGSNNRNKARIRLAKTYLKIANQRKDYLHKVTSKIVNENQIIIMEDLNVAGMVKNHCLAKAIQDVGLYEFKRQIQYKSNWQDKIFYQVNKFYPSSKTCFHCGNIYKGLKLSERVWKCSNCQKENKRDETASANILWYGLKRLIAESTVGVTGIKACGLPAYGIDLLSKSVSNGSVKQETNLN